MFQIVVIISTFFEIIIFAYTHFWKWYICTKVLGDAFKKPQPHTYENIINICIGNTLLCKIFVDQNNNFVAGKADAVHVTSMEDIARN